MLVIDQPSIFDCALYKWIAHVSTAIVHGIDLVFVIEDGDMLTVGTGETGMLWKTSPQSH
tara:strand:+ start:566 stop:745 length:180 start_codon:yes stop_codon:yes gene_type:complete